MSGVYHCNCQKCTARRDRLPMVRLWRLGFVVLTWLAFLLACGWSLDRFMRMH